MQEGCLILTPPESNPPKRSVLPPCVIQRICDTLHPVCKTVILSSVVIKFKIQYSYFLMSCTVCRALILVPELKKRDLAIRKAKQMAVTAELRNIKLKQDIEGLQQGRLQSMTQSLSCAPPIPTMVRGSGTSARPKIVQSTVTNNFLLGGLYRWPDAHALSVNEPALVSV